MSAKKIPRSEFDVYCRSKFFIRGPFVSTFGDGHGEPYIPYEKRNVWGTLETGEDVWADHE